MRIGAFDKITDDAVYFFGYGDYLGDEIPPSNITFLGMPIVHEIPKLQLDNGDIIWGTECGWNEIELMKEEIGNKEIIMVNIENYRK